MNITILNAEAAEKEMLDACIEHALRFDGDCDIEVYNRVPLNAPNWRNPGWLEYVLIIGKIHIRAIQRRPGAEVEFHS